MFQFLIREDPLQKEILSDADGILNLNSGGMEEDDPMQFHPVSQGSSIILDMGGHRATRDVDSFCNGVVFSKVGIVTRSSHFDIEC